MTDARIHKLAHLLVHYSLEVKPGQLVKITGERVTLPLLIAAAEEVVKAGGQPYIDTIIPEFIEAMLKFGNDKQLSFVSPLAKLEAEKMDCFLVVWGDQNTKYLGGTDPKRQALRQKARGPIVKRIFQRVGKKELSWVGTQFPTHAAAQDAGMSLRTYEDFVYGTGHITSADPIKHWKKIRTEQERLVKILERVGMIRVRSNDTDLSIKVDGRKWVSCHGDQNFPDGEVFTSPHETGVNGTIHYSFPCVYSGREVNDVRLTFKNGRVVKEEAASNLAYLTAMLNMDKGARTIGEFAIGTNYQITNYSKNTLFDEKIGGTCHCAVGAGFPEAGGKNHSALHWDMVCDLRQGGVIEADGKTIHRNGKFTI